MKDLSQTDRRDLLQWRYQLACKGDDLERGLGDVLDVKASIVLVAVTFLAAISKDLITMPDLPAWWKITQLLIQLVDISLLAAVGILVLSELRPKDYLLDSTPQEDEDWIYKLERSIELNVVSEVLEQKITMATKRARHNGSLNSAKSKKLHRAFKLLEFAAGVTLLNLFALGLRALWIAVAANLGSS